MKIKIKKKEAQNLLDNCFLTDTDSLFKQHVSPAKIHIKFNLFSFIYFNLFNIVGISYETNITSSFPILTHCIYSFCFW